MRNDVRRRVASTRVARLLPGQICGYWFDTAKDVPLRKPAYDYTAAVLPRLGGSLTSAPCLDLVPIQGVWYPLSEAAIYTYSHSADLVRGRVRLFVPDESDWPRHRYEARLFEPIERRDIAGEYGPRAAQRARPDYPAVRLVLTPLG